MSLLERHGFPNAPGCPRPELPRDVEHCHLLFHLPTKFRSGAKSLQVEAAIARLVRLHAGGVLHEKAVDLRVHDNPDGKYLLKGGGPKVWTKFGLRKEHRRLQGLISGKRCGVSKNIGPAARARHRLALKSRAA